MIKPIFLFFALFLSVVTATAGTLNAVAAIVNNDIITQAQLTTAMSQAKAQLAASQNPPTISDAKLRRQVLQQLIDQKIQLELAKRAHITASPAEVTHAIARIAANNHVTLAQLKNKLQQQGMRYADYRHIIRQQLIMHTVAQGAVGAHLHVTPADLKNALMLYRSQTNGQMQLHVMDIVAPTQTAAQAIIAQLKQGTSINTVSPKNTQDLGWQTTGTLPTLFLKALSTMKTGDIAGPIAAPNGFHVIKLIGMKGGLTKPSAMQLRNIAYQIKLNQAIGKWMKTVRKTAYIKINS
jgi:peptidyl-prolyl cis-trans isomerase SurA